MTDIDNRIELWKRQLLDLGKRNRLIGYKETKNTNIRITRPGYSDLYKKLIIHNRSLRFPYSPPKALEDEEDIAEFTKGDLATDKNIAEQQKVLGSLRTKAKEGFEEQGMNTLYLSFGFLNWNDGSSDITSPLVLVPVSLTSESIADPFVMELSEEPIVVNPMLVYKLREEFQVELPEFNPDENLETYFNQVSEVISQKGWSIDDRVDLALLSFLRISMYQDLDANTERIKNNAVIKALCGDGSDLPPLEPMSSLLDHDKKKSLDSFEILDADSSQEDALVLARNGISFVLEGPPGTGKSQTIANMISEAMADGKKILFVSEKMAALDIVYRRLAEAGLSDFCMILHSHKVNKRDVIDELKSVLYSDRTPSEYNMDDLYELDMEKNELDDYANDLHKIVNPLGISVYRVCGELSKYQDAKDLDFKMDNLATIDLDTLMRKLYSVRAWSRTIEAAAKTSPWTGCTFMQRPTPGEKDLIESKLKEMNKTLSSVISTLSEKYKSLGMEFKDVSFNDMDNCIEAFNHFSESPLPPEIWFEKDNLDVLRESTDSLAALMDEYASIKQRLLQSYDPKILEISHASAAEKTAETEMQFLRENLAMEYFADEDGILRGADRLIRSLGEAVSVLNGLEKVKEAAQFILPSGKPIMVADLVTAAELLDLLNGPLYPSSAWFDEHGRSVRDKTFEDVLSKHIKIKSIENEIANTYDAQIMNLPCAEMLERFKGAQKGFGLKFGQHGTDLKTLKAVRKDSSKKLDDAEARDILSKVITLKDEKEWLAANRNSIIDKLGPAYDGYNTDFDALKKSFSTFDEIIDICGGTVPESIRNMLLNGVDSSSDVSADIQRLTSKFESLRDLEPMIKNLSLSEMDAPEALSECTRMQNALLNLKRSILPVIELSLSPVGYSVHIMNLKRLVRLQALCDLDTSKKPAMEAEFGSLYVGMSTDFRKISEYLDWTIKFKELVSREKIPSKTAKRIMSNKDAAKACGNLADLVHKSKLELEEDIEWFDALFSPAIGAPAMSLKDLESRTSACLGSLSQIDEQADFNRTSDECEKEGLSNYMSAVLNEGLMGEDAVNAFLKSFYSMWLEKILTSSSSLRKLCGSDHAEAVKRFDQLDKSHLSTSKIRIKNKILSRLPNPDDPISSSTEMTILKHEINKQKGGMPAAKLIQKIPHLIMDLKPCIMMSPLSVSLFLQNDDYEFDMVIFDEASQVRTESAVGAIMRSKQTIIVGDVRQLPPTNFFSTYGGDSDSEDDDVFLESILDEEHALPVRSLRWHYRSKDESLIAFSNYNIYGGSLITFPSCNDNKNSCVGVEYIYVDDGVYDRGKKRCNVKEARRVADLVFEHIKSGTTQSLGVIAASEAQMEAIESVINFMRYQNRDCEDFFREDKDEPFFIKNIENVQGDERDVIIFSLGYGKDNNGKMYMNFGPLSKKGGSRRLNVAVTRARCNLKFVASILPEDLDATEGDMGMIKSYLEYAINGSDSLISKFTAPETTKSVFEESVLNFIQSHGYTVKPRLGCSEYRIDLAIVDPNDPTRYALGIECDGYVYHSARTARERERLRYSMLESMGWKIYRLHALDWVRDQEAEASKLLKTIESAVNPAQ